ncbi:MAG TPA: glutamine--fructose-6-phosphate transaminase (isomerizing) [Candidatus Marinimicrobia bacterium]|nr:glutamine--fructose-6-phosphate transaminase (isomerizing) [Candidatus Neomarinimicrobiota bacterium]
MCGIIGYIGNRDAVPLLLKGLKRLEYRGYDSAGIAVLTDGQIHSIKKSGKVSQLEVLVDDTPMKGSIGIAHTRWATHGEPNDINAHPHLDHTGRIALIHNGIIENHETIRKVLEERDIPFTSDTDSEALVQLVSAMYFDDDELSFEGAFRAALQDVVGAYGVVAVCAEEPETVLAARMGSPLVIGIGEGEYFLASDASPIVEYTRNVIYLDEGEMVKLTPDNHSISRIDSSEIVSRGSVEIEMSIEQIEKGDFDHFMLKEIHEQKHTITDTMRGRLNLEDGTTHLGGIADFKPSILAADRVYITACGTSWHAALIGKQLIENYAQIPVDVEYASEFRYRNAIINPDTVLIAVSQSGETADTLAAIRKAKNLGALTIGICNVVGSSIARETDAGIYTHAGPEIGVASTKAFTAQVAVMTMLALSLGRRKGFDAGLGRDLTKALHHIDNDIQTILDDDQSIRKVAQDTHMVDNFLYLGRGINFPVALEGALKLKEISYIHAEGYPAAEMKHGPIALIDENMPVVFIAPRDDTYSKILSNIQEVKARRGIVISITDRKTRELDSLSDHLLEVPRTHKHVFPITASIILQLLAYHLAVLRGCEIDQPRNLAKSVTVE